MIPKPVAIVMGAAATSGYVEYNYGSSMISTPRTTQLAAITPAILLGTGFWAFTHGFVVGKARTKYAELAREDGETDVDERYLLPNLYVQGTSKHAMAFNCIQRSHQHIFETYTQAVLGGLAGMISFPISTAISSMMYAIGRVQLSRGYAAAEGDPKKRYEARFSIWMWFGFLGNVCFGLGSCGLIMAGKKKL
ncbi:hypothetical protein ACHAW6_010966 [Cyclotella cf. meneghiniana]